VRKGFLASTAALLAWAGLSLAQYSSTGQGVASDASGGPGAAPPPGAGSTGGAAAGAASTPPSASAPAAPSVFSLPGLPVLTGHGPDDLALPVTDDETEYGPGPTPYRLWASGEYLLWWVKPGVQPAPLATTGPASSNGILGQPGVTALLGGSELEFPSFSGARITLGGWLDKGGHIGIEASGFILEHNGVDYSVASDPNDNGVIGRPVINALTGLEAVSLVASPGQLAGSLNVTSSEQFYSAETNLIGSLYRGKSFTADMIVGFRYAGLQEDFSVSTTSTVLPGGAAAFNGALIGPGNTLAILDHFETRNDFYGGQVGAKTQFRFNRLFVDISGKLGVGNNHEVVKADGSTTLIGPGGSVATLPGGLLAVSSNSGIFSRDEFTFLPEASIKFGVHLTNYATAYVGYTFMYWYDVARAADQIDRVVNPTLVPSNLAFGTGGGPNLPSVPFNRTDFWAQGINFGVELRY